MRRKLKLSRWNLGKELRAKFLENNNKNFLPWKTAKKVVLIGILTIIALNV